VLTIIDDRKAALQDSIKLLNAYSMSLGESVSSGPFFKAYLSNLLPGQFMQPFVDAAFSDLGLDRPRLSPSQRVDPQTGQPATPATSRALPRTGRAANRDSPFPMPSPASQTIALPVPRAAAAAAARWSPTWSTRPRSRARRADPLRRSPDGGNQ